MKAARPTVSVDRLGMKDWLDLHRVYAELVLSPLPDLALIGQTEGYWTLNAGEAAFLDLVAESRPPQSHEGAYASWMEAYGDVLTHGVSLDQEDDFRAGVPRLGCLDAEVAPCGRERVLDRFAALAPTAAGEEDNEQWMWELALWAPLTASAGALYEADTQRQLDRVDRVRPARLRGARSYQVWLSTVADTAGDPAVLDHSVMPAKPCVEGTAGDADYAAFLAANGYLPAARKTAAAPQHCP